MNDQERAQKYAAWIVANKDKKGTLNFDKVAAAYKQVRSTPVDASSKAPQKPLAHKSLAQDATDLYQRVKTKLPTADEAMTAARKPFAAASRTVDYALGSASPMKRLDELSQRFIEGATEDVSRVTEPGVLPKVKPVLDAVSAPFMAPQAWATAAVGDPLAATQNALNKKMGMGPGMSGEQIGALVSAALPLGAATKAVQEGPESVRFLLGAPKNSRLPLPPGAITKAADKPKIPLTDVSEIKPTGVAAEIARREQAAAKAEASQLQISNQLGVKPLDTAALAAQRKQLRAQFANDEQYVTHLGERMNKSILQDEKAVELAAQYRRAEEIKHEVTLPQKEASTLPSAGEIQKILKKPAFERDAIERMRLRQAAKAEGWGGPWADQRGFITPMMSARLASMGIGSAAGAKLDPEHPIQGAIIGAGVGAMGPGAAKLLWENRQTLMSGQTYRNMWNEIRAEGKYDLTKPLDLIRKNFANTFTTGRTIWQLQKQIEHLLPNAEDRVAITKALDSGVRPVIPAQAEVYDLVKKFYEDFGQHGLESGVIKALRDNYATRVFGNDAKSVLEYLVKNEKTIYGSTKSPFAKARETNLPLATIQRLVEEGRLPKTSLPKTLDIRDIVGIYGNSMSKAIENKKLLEALKNLKGEGDEFMVMPAAKAPRTYVTMDHPQMLGLHVHPELAPSLRFIFDKSDPGAIGQALLAFNTASKRSSVSFSAFHLRSLLSAKVNAMGGPQNYPRALKELVTDLRNESTMQKMLREGGAGDLVDVAGRAGLKFSFSHGPQNAVEDIAGVGRDLPQEGLAATQRFLRDHFDTVLPGASKAVAGLQKANHWVDEMMWARAHAGMKLDLFSKEYEKLLMSNAKTIEAGKKGLPPEVLARHAAGYVNDIFGGLNWFEIAHGVQNKYGRYILQRLFSPSGRRGMQMLMFAPDWTLSTTRAIAKAFMPTGSGGKGLLKPMNATDLHRRYVTGAALSYVTLMDGMNYALSGHHIWQNKDPTRIEFRDGRTMQFDKHSMEAMEWLLHPGKTALNKLSPGIKEGMEQATGAQYLGADPRNPQNRLEGFGARLGHVAEKFVPISLQNLDLSKEGLIKTASSFAGFPIYGETHQERAKRKATPKKKTPQEYREEAKRRALR